MATGDGRQVIAEWEKTLKGDYAVAYQEAKSNRTIVRTKLTKAINFVRNALSSNDTFEIRDALTTVQRLRDELEQRDSAVQILMADSEFVLDSDEEISRTGWLDVAVKTIALAQRKLVELDMPSTPAQMMHPRPPGTTPATSKVKLPKVNLPKFTGKSPSEYKTFMNKFKSLVDNDSSLDDVQKLLYLQSCCEQEAATIADGYAVTGENYKELLDAFHQMFGLKRLVVQSYMETLIDLPNCSAVGLKSFLNTLETAVRSVKEYGVHSEHISPVIIPLVERKLLKEDYQKWRELIFGDDEFSLDKLIKFLHERLLCLPPEPQVTGSKPGMHKPKAQATTTLLATGCQLKCNLCENINHSTVECRRFVKAKPQKRYEMVKEKHLCFKCFEKSSKSHNSSNCFASNCDKCGKPHHSLLHIEKPQVPVQSSTAVEKVEEVAINVTPVTQTRKLLKTLIIPAQEDDKRTTLRTLVDGASDEAWITSKVKDNLGLKTVGHTTISVAAAFADKFGEPKQVDIVEVNLITSTGAQFPVKAYVHDGPIVVPVKAVEFNPTKKYPHLHGLEVADVYPRGPQHVDLILGTAYEEKIRTGRRRIGREGPDAIETLFGWVLSGQLTGGLDEEVTINRIAAEGVDEQLRKFWEIEEIPTLEKSPMEETDTLHRFKQSARYDESTNQYVVCVPYSDELKNLLPNWDKVSKITSQQEAKLEKRPELKIHVQKMLREQLESGIIEKVGPDDDLEGPGKHYLPWHTVIRPGHLSTPVRIVYNLSNKDKNGLSLNSCQTSGPNLLPDTVGLLIKFRTKKTAFTLDIKKMFHQIKLDPSQVDLHRFKAFGELYRFLVLIMGEKSSPFCAMAVCLLHADRMSDLLPLACEVIRECLYMDDPVSGADALEDAVATVKQLLEFFTSIHMKLHKLSSNSKELLSNFDEAIVKKTSITGILGLEWNTESDTLLVRNAPSEAPITKREVLSVISKIFDPLGFHSPLTCKGKMLMQALWKEKCEWKDPIPEGLQTQVEAWMESSKHQLQFPRYVGPLQEVHIFSDASEQACAVAAYAVNEKQSTLILSKTRVKPLKVVTLPRMELMAAVMSAKVFTHLQQQLGVAEATFWTDSEIVLNWIREESSDYKTFVGNRISQIQTSTSMKHWMWTPSSENPADYPSRGIWPLSQDQERLWKNGPEFLRTKEFPAQPNFVKPDEEIRKTTFNVAAVQPAERLLDVTRFSKLSRLVNTFCYVVRFVTRKGGKDPPTVEERNHALGCIIKGDQAQHFAKDIANLSKDGCVSKKSRLKALNPKLDDSGILRMHGRDANYTPIILDPASYLTKLIVEDCHTKNLHCGPASTLTLLRNKYWILRGLQTAKKIGRSCVVCKKLNEPLCQEQMAPLPQFRITPSHPFTHVGVDYAGPLTVTKGAQKRYILLFTCGSTRAVHLELTRTMNTNDFNMGFRRFMARRGKPTVVYSDNAKTFLRAKQDYATHGIDWKFITPRAPWQGAFYERMVRMVKEPLRKTLGSAILNEVELTTVLTQVEAMINERPLTAILDGDLYKPITPSMLLNGRCLYHTYTEDDGFAPTKRLKYMEHLKDQFWRSWKKRYLPSLMERSKWTNRKDNPIAVGEIVLLLKENAKRHTWPLGRVTETIPGRDGLIRSVKILVDGKEFTRPVQHIVRLCV